MNEKENYSKQVIILGGVILLSIMLVVLTTSGTVSTSYSFSIPKNINNDNYNSQEEFVTISFSNSGTFFPKRAKIPEIIACVYDREDNTLLHDITLDTYRYIGTVNSNVFNLNDKFIDISAGDTVDVVYRSYSALVPSYKSYDINYSQYDIDDLIIEYREITGNNNNYYYGMPICEGTIDSEVIYTTR